MRRGLALAIVLILAALSLIIAESAIAQSIPKPSVPEFTVRLIDHPYNVPSSTTTSTDPYTGKQTITTYPGYHVQNSSIEVSIKNQQFTPYSINNQNTLSLFYNVSYKGHYTGDWTYYPWNGSYSRNSYAVTRIPQSTSDYTVVPFAPPTEGQMDFRVQAQIGYYDSYQDDSVPVPGAPFTHYIFTGEVSGWSNTQTINLADGSVFSTSLAPNPTPSSTVPEFPLWTIPLLLTVMVALAGLVVYHKKRKLCKTKP
jgi:hypothetical protein